MGIVFGIIDDEVAASKIEWFLHSRREASDGLLFRGKLDVSKTPRSPIVMSVCLLLLKKNKSSAEETTHEV